jgi:hypothetical protein
MTRYKNKPVKQERYAIALDHLLRQHWSVESQEGYAVLASAERQPSSVSYQRDYAWS